jgi:hypothetical protein
MQRLLLATNLVEAGCRSDSKSPVVVRVVTKTYSLTNEEYQGALFLQESELNNT